jgi:hypothetical protein
MHVNETAALYELYAGRGLRPDTWVDIPGLRIASHSTYGQQFCLYPFPVSRTQNLKPWQLSRSLFRPAQGRNSIVICPNPYMEGGRVWKMYPQKLRQQVEASGGTCGSPESPFPYYLERIADFVAAGPAWMIADGGLAYRGVCTREKRIAGRFLRSLPRADYQPSAMNLEPAFLFTGRNDQGRYGYLVNRQEYPVTVHLAVSGADALRQLDNSAEHPVRNGQVTLKLAAFGMIAFELPDGAAIDGGRVNVPPAEIDRVKTMVAQARAIFDAADPETINTFTRYQGRPIRSRERPANIYAQAKIELQAAEKALTEQRWDTADRYIRGYIPHNDPDPRGFALPLLYGAMNRWPDGVFNMSVDPAENPG